VEIQQHDVRPHCEEERSAHVEVKIMRHKCTATTE
jgi:hypothetical protein